METAQFSSRYPDVARNGNLFDSELKDLPPPCRNGSVQAELSATREHRYFPKADSRDEKPVAS
jgi:hypothetical protein